VVSSPLCGGSAARRLARLRTNGAVARLFPPPGGRLLRTATLLCQKTVGEGVEVKIRVAEDLWATRIDPGQSEAALLNLSANARDAMDGRGRLTITAENVANGAHEDISLAAGPYVVVSATDTGCGMSKEVLAHAFEPFHTTKEIGKGTGLGLSQVYGFATHFRGIARVARRKGRGTTVRLYLREPRDGEPD
jgi:signal transduction histidine kinase